MLDNIDVGTIERFEKVLFFLLDNGKIFMRIYLRNNSIFYKFIFHKQLREKAVEEIND